MKEGDVVAVVGIVDWINDPKLAEYLPDNWADADKGILQKLQWKIGQINEDLILFGGGEIEAAYVVPHLDDPLWNDDLCLLLHCTNLEGSKQLCWWVPICFLGLVELYTDPISVTRRLGNRLTGQQKEYV